MKRVWIYLALSSVLAGCGKGGFSKGSQTQKDSTFSYALNNKVTTLDPGKVQDIDMTDVIKNVYEGLVEYDENNKLVPRLAEKWEVKDGGKTYVFTLRKGVKFHNGRELKAEDFKWTFERNLKPSLASPVAGNYLDTIAGVKEYVEGKAKEVSGIKVVDDHTLSITLDKPRPYFLGNLTYPCAFALAKEATGDKEISDMAHSIGTGPFKYSRIEPEQEIDLLANKDYYEGPPPVDSIARPIVKDGATRLNMFKTGAIQFLTLDRRDVAGIKADAKLSPQLHFELRPAINYFLLNQNAYPPFKDQRVRMAFTIGINRPHIVRDVLPGFLEAKGLIADGVPGYRPNLPGIPYDLEKAKKLLADAGYPNGKGLPPLILAYKESTNDARAACEAAATSLTQDLGVPVTVQSYEWGTMLAKRDKNELQFAFLSWYADYLDPQNFLSLLLSTQSKLNHDGYSNPKFDQLCDAADVEQDPEKRTKMYQQAEDILIADAARIPLFFQNDPVLVNPRLTGIKANIFGLMPNRTAKLAP